MKIRCDLHVNGTNRKLILVPRPHETVEHLGLKLAAYVLFWDQEPIVEASVKHPALLNQEFIPDLMGLGSDGQATLWVECGQVTMHKLTKLTRRFPGARLIVIKEDERQAQRLRSDMLDELDRHEKVEVLAWPNGLFKEWMSTLQEKTEVYGEGGGLTLNVVVNEKPFVADFKVF